MRAFIGLIRAELLQHRAGMIITPLVIAALIGTFFMAQLIFNTSGVDFNLGQFNVQLDNDTVVSNAAQGRTGAAIGAALGLIGVPIFLTANIVAFFVMLSALYEERTERTILFFKSMPVSDTQSVLAKYVTASFIGPFIAILVMIGLVFMVSVLSALVFSLRGVSDVWSYLTELPFLKLLVTFMGYYTLYALWVAPIYAYLLFMSAIAPRSPFLFALLPIAVLGIAEAIFLSSAKLFTEINVRAVGVRFGEVVREARGVTGMERARSLDDFFIQFGDVFATLLTPSVWMGLLVAAAFLSLAIWARSRKTL